jgi:hypothetical protein
MFLIVVAGYGKVVETRLKLSEYIFGEGNPLYNYGLLFGKSRIPRVLGTNWDTTFVLLL